MSQDDRIQLLRLRGREHERLLELFHRTVYSPAFPIVSERESVRTWKELLWGGNDTCQLHVLVAGSRLRSRTPRLVAGHVFEYYPHSRCGLLTYLVVHPRHRRQGLGRRLFSAAISILKETARKRGSRLRAIFAEVNDPKKVRRADDVMKPTERLVFFEGLGGRILDLPYIQPELEPGQGRGRQLLLLQMHPVNSRRRSIDADLVFKFLEEFYRAVETLGRDRDFKRMLAAERDGRIAIRAGHTSRRSGRRSGLFKHSRIPAHFQI